MVTSKYIEETVTYMKKVPESCTCDWCKKEIGVDYGNRGYDTREFCLSFSTGSEYPDGSGSKSGWQVNDLCNDCVEKLYHLLISQGVNIENTEVDW